MSVDIRLPLSSLLKRRETTSLFCDDVSKCGEIFVTNNAEKLTFLCSYCQEINIELGAFICHIRMEHFNTDLAHQHQIRQSQQSPEQQPKSEIVKEEETMASSQYFETICFKVSEIVDTTSLNQPQNGDAKNFNVNKNFITTSQYNSTENNEDVFTITPKLSVETQESSSETDNKEFVTVVKVENEAADKTEYDGNTKNFEKEQDDDDSKTSCYFPSEDDMDADDTDFEINNGNQASGSSKIEKEWSSADSMLPRYKCPNCPKRVKNKKALQLHVLRYHHNKLEIKCERCNRGFHSEQGLNVHLKSQCENVLLPCPACATKYSRSQFIVHVLTHESDTCFPCQVCGKVYTSNEERIKHWKTHAEEKPFHCPTCYRRFVSHGILERHLRIHRQYRCSVCAAEFNTSEKQQLPYVCMACGISGTDLNQEAITKLEYGSDGAPNKQIVEDITNDDSNKQCYNTLNDTDGDDVSNQDDPDLEFIDESCDIARSRVIESKKLQIKTTASGHRAKGDNSFKYKCDICDKIYKARTSLFIHKREHNQTQRYQCPVCSKAANREAVFIKHVMQHENESCFPCQVCAKLFNTNAERVKHWETHIAERPYGCDICHRRFRYIHILNSHLKSHSLLVQF